MIDRELQKLKYETSAHHRQILRENIDQRMIDSFQISQNPSKNYQMAYKDLYKDELQKSVLLYDQKKAVEQTKKEYETQVAGKHLKLYKNDEPLRSSVSAVNLHNLNYRDVGYVDYDLLKETRALDHTLKNYDGGMNFFKNSEIQRQNQRLQQQKMRQTLLQQINEKQNQKSQYWSRRKEQENAIRSRAQAESMHEYQLRLQEAQERARHRDDILQQMQQQRVRRGKRTMFSYNNMTRHNPITNPIEYHIENPYILRQIQNKSVLGGESERVRSLNRNPFEGRQNTTIQ